MTDAAGARADFVKGLSDVLVPAVTETDNRVRALFEAQEALQKEIHRLSKELETFIDAAQVPSLAIYTQKLNNAKQRMDNINAVLQRIQDRVGRIEKNFINKK
mmetsp:Transcript_7199/g.8910  ORF Transcript_7199/g.8910 Transcript_7199/m.8910 type:complete len:103 (-) Transcript_7199:74-382(-)